jgi:phosphoribosylformylglycinamidine synthase
MHYNTQVRIPARRIIEVPMKARVYVLMKSTVLDPQGQTVRNALVSQGHRAVEDVRQGKYFEIVFADSLSREEARRELDTLARDVLSNPVIEEYRLEFVD